MMKKHIWKRIIITMLLICGMVCLEKPTMPEVKAEIYGDYEYTVLEDGTVEITAYTGYEEGERLEIPAQIDGKNVTSIESYAFQNYEGEIIIPDTVRSIKDSAFCSCQFTQIIIPKDVEYIGGAAFWNCSSLSSITVEEGNKNYDSREACNAIIEKESNILTQGCKSTKIPASVTGIGNYAFAGCDVTEINIPSGVTSIGDYAFFWCERLRKITIPNSVTTIGDHAFDSCYNLTKITIPSGVQLIGEDIFGDAGVYVIQVEPNNTIYDSREGCNAIIETASNILIAGCQNTVIPDSVTGIGAFAFSQCDGLTHITIPSGVKSIGDSAFECCWDLTEITIPDSVTEIGEYAFEGCPEDMIIYTVSGSVAEQYAEENGYIVKMIGDKPVTPSKEENLSGDYKYKVLEDGTVEITHYIGTDEQVEIPAQIDGKNVTSIGEGAFRDSFVASVSIPDSVKSIGDDAFDSCSRLTEIMIPNSVTSIGRDAFCDTAWLANKRAENPLVVVNGILIDGYACVGVVDILDNVTSIGESAFYSCTGLTEITIPDSVTDIGENAFNGCTGLTKLMISAKNIGEGAFSGCENVTEVRISSNVESIGRYAFLGCSNLGIIQIDENNKKYDSRDNCNAIIETESNTLIQGCQNTKIPNTVMKLGESAFRGGQVPTEITIPGSVKSIEQWSFLMCEQLRKVIIQDGVTHIAYSAFDECFQLKEVTIPASVTDIESWAFNWCPGDMTIYTVPDSAAEKYAKKHAYMIQWIEGTEPVTTPDDEKESGDWKYRVVEDGTVEITGYKGTGEKIKLPAQIDGKNVTGIAEYAFSGCDFTEIEILSGVVNIGNSAFSCCEYLTKITIPDSVKTIGEEDIFEGCTKDITIYTVSGSVAEKYAKEYGYTVQWIESGQPSTPPAEEEKKPSDNKNPSQGNNNQKPQDTPVIPPAAKGTVLTVNGEKCKIKVLSEDASNPTASYQGTTDKKAAAIKVPDTVTVNNITYTITDIADKAFSGNKKIKKVTIGKNVTSIGKDAFKNCTKLKSVDIKSTVLNKIGANAFSGSKKLTKITLKTTKLASKSIGKNALKGTSKKLVIKAPKKKVKDYQKYFRKKGNKSVKVKK